MLTPGNVIDPCTNNSTSRRRIRRKTENKTLLMLTHGTIHRCGLISLIVCINDGIYDVKERNVTIRSEI